MLDSMYKTMSISSGLYPNLDLWNANKLQLQLQLQNPTCSAHSAEYGTRGATIHSCVLFLLLLR